MYYKYQFIFTNLVNLVFSTSYILMPKILFQLACLLKDRSAYLLARCSELHSPSPISRLCVSHKAYHSDLKMIKRVGTDK